MISFLFQKKPTAEEVAAAMQRRAKYAEEQAARPVSKVEALARAYCEELGYDPEEGRMMASGWGAYPLWKDYSSKAEAALSADAMARALARTEGKAE